MNEQPVWKTVGKQVLADAVTLAKDTGAFIYELTKHLVKLIKNAADKTDNEQKNDNTSAASA